MALEIAGNPVTQKKLSIKQNLHLIYYPIIWLNVLNFGLGLWM